MKKVLLVILVLLGIAAIAAVFLNRSDQTAKDVTHDVSPSHEAMHPQPSKTEAARVPAHYEDVKSAGKLAPTLPPEQFFGKARQAYKAAKEIPEILAQLPCYCYCDASYGHKSLHTCYESDHSSHCAVCVDEALMAYQLQKEEGLTAPQIRERIVAKYSQKQ